MSYDVTNKTILVTGANRGIGKALVDGFIKHGAAKVYAAVRSLESAAFLVAEYGEKIIPIRIDLEDPKSITTAAETAKDVEVVVNNAGVMRITSPFDDDVFESLDFELKVNVYGLINMARAFAPVLKSNGGGAFVQLNSVASLKGFAKFATYSASKAAAYSITQALREVLGKQGTTVLTVHPGPIATDMGEAAGFAEIALPPELVAEEVVAALRSGDFHLFPDSLAKQVGSVYQTFAENIIEADLIGE